MRRIRKRNRKILIILAIVAAIALCAAAAYYIFHHKQPEEGDISEVSMEEAVVEEATMPNGKEPYSQFNATEPPLGYEWDEMKVGRAQLVLPYPKGWTIEKNTDYDALFTAPDNDKELAGVRIYFHSTLEPQEITNVHKIKEGFNQQICSDKFFANGRNVKYSPVSEYEKRVVNTKVSDPNLQLHISYRDWDCMTTDYTPDSGLYHQITAFSWYGTPVVLTGMCMNDDADKLNDVMLYMMSNSRYERDALGVTANTEALGLKFKMSPLYEPSVLQKSDDGIIQEGKSYVCPVNTGTGFSQSAILILKINEKDWKSIDFDEDFEEELRDDILIDAFGDNYLECDVAGYMDSTMKGSVKFGDTDVAEHVYRFSFTDVNGLSGCFANQSWILSMYPIKNGKDIDLVAYLTTQGGLTSSFDVLLEMASTMK